MMLTAARVLPDRNPEADLDNWELLIGAILSEAAELRQCDRSELATRILALGGYESLDGTDQSNASARLALQLAARLAEPFA